MKAKHTFSLFVSLFLLSVCLGTKAENDSTFVAPSRLQIGGYGEATMSRMFYSDNWKRYTSASSYKDAPSHGEFDLPHVVLMLNYDFGRGWKMGSEIEFEHGGTESAVEIEQEETGEYEKEIERGGEVALEQFWLEKRHLMTVLR